ncbi:HEPN domain-containing protein [Arenimonas caeni]|uniref:Uncharacterized protein n=1 Tax=Arenimonas caeni TaxID=2058085 RepID=A0A2P6M5M5_9GAMM|nr:HEPN domain-containing protein [Arenimonas caeni]PRH81308.1 hypothetical protein C6N40_13295 [Arenimonas caeni]
MPTAAELRERFKAIPQEATPDAWRVRIHRALSWLARAEAEPDDPDARFLFLWIALNAAYAREIGAGETERGRLREFLARLVALDQDGRLHAAIFGQFSGPIRTLIENKHVYQPFWMAQQTWDQTESWREGFEAGKRAALGALMEKDTTKVLSIVFDRLYVLRNQLVHGGATWNSGINRQQVKDGATILGTLLPMVVDLMLVHPDADHGEILYPVVR